jgi:glucokinase
MTSSGSSATDMVVGLDLGQTSIKGGLVSRSGELVLTHQAASQIHVHPDAWFDNVVRAALELCRLADTRGLTLLGVGLSSTIDVDAASGQIRSVNYSALKPWLGFDIASALQERLGLPTLVENDGIAATWGEYRAGAGRGARSMLNVTLGTGIGGGAVLDGQHLPDSVGSGAYFGHITIDFEGLPCPCGMRGCWELYASGTALERRAAQAVASAPPGTTQLEPDPGAKAVVGAALAGDGLARSLIDEHARYLAYGLVSLLNLFNPEVVVIGGGLAQAGDLLLEPTRALVDRLRIPLRKSVPIKAAELGAYSGVVGAGLLILDQIESGRP